MFKMYFPAEWAGACNTAPDFRFYSPSFPLQDPMELC